MDTYMLALKYNLNNKVDELVIGNYPWKGMETVTLLEASARKNSFCNIGITSNLDLVGTSGDLHRYTRIDDKGNIIKLSYVILAQSQAYKGNMYFVADGVNNPKWMSTSEIIRHIQIDGHSLANGKLNIDDNIIEPLSGDFKNVDFKESQLEYREYIKGLARKV